MNRHKTIDELLDAVDNMSIYQQDQEIIVKLAKLVSPKMFTKIIEEIIDGELYWSDFEQILSNTEYPAKLRETLSIQKDIEEYIKKLTSFRSTFLKTISTGADYAEIAISETVNHSNKVYTDEYNYFRDNMLYEITKLKKGDSFLQIACKLRLYNAIKNGDLIISAINNKTENTDNKVSINGKSYIIENNIAKAANDSNENNGRFLYSDNNVNFYDAEDYFVEDIHETIHIDEYDEDGKAIMIYDDSDSYYTKTFEYIDKEDIFLFLNNYFVPVLYKYQTLDDNDRLFMSKYNLTEDQIKQYKSLGLLLRRGLS